MAEFGGRGGSSCEPAETAAGLAVAASELAAATFAAAVAAATELGMASAEGAECVTARSELRTRPVQHRCSFDRSRSQWSERAPSESWRSAFRCASLVRLIRCCSAVSCCEDPRCSPLFCAVLSDRLALPPSIGSAAQGAATDQCGVAWVDRAQRAIKSAFIRSSTVGRAWNRSNDDSIKIAAI